MDVLGKHKGLAAKRLWLCARDVFAVLVVSGEQTGLELLSELLETTTVCECG